MYFCVSFLISSTILFTSSAFATTEATPVTNPAPPLESSQEVKADSESGHYHLPLYELGLGLGTAWIPHYPGSDQMRLFVIPFPYGVYRGSVLRADRNEGARARFFRGEGYEVSLSIDGALPVESEGNRAREGMPDLGWMAEMGPKLRIKLTSPTDRHTLRVGLAMRGVLAFPNFPSAEHRGWIAEPELIYERADLHWNRMGLFFRISSYFSDVQFARYLYEVGPEYAKADRPLYRAQQGYLYSNVGFGVSYTLTEYKTRVFTYVSQDFLDGAANVDSPLVKTRNNHLFGIAIISSLYQSKQRAQAHD